MEFVSSYLWTIFALATLHFFGDYVLQSEFIAKTKGENWYHLLVHSTLYAFPFWIMFKFTWPLVVLLITHFMIDALKARYKKISYITDQSTHFTVIFIVYGLWRMMEVAP